MKNNKLTRGKVAVLVTASVPMAAAGIAGGVASYFNFAHVLTSKSNAASLVLAGEGVTLVCALVALAVTLMGQHTPAPVRAGLWIVPLVASVAGVLIAPDMNTRIVMGLSPLAMTAAGEGITLVARRIVAYSTGVDIEQQRRNGLLLWHANRAANGSGLAKRRSEAAVWRLTKQFAATDGVTAEQLTAIQRGRIAEGADVKLARVLGGNASVPFSQPLAIENASVPELPAPAPQTAPETPSEGHDKGTEFIEGLLSKVEQDVRDDVSVKLLTTNEVAAQLGVSPGTVRSWKSRGKLTPYETVDGSPMYHPVDVAKMP